MHTLRSVECRLASAHFLHVLTQFVAFGEWRSTACHSIAIAFQLMQNLIGTDNDTLRHARQLGHVNTKTMLRPAAYQLAQEDNLAIHFAYRHIIVAYARERLFHLVQFVVVGGKKGLGMPALLMDILHNRPRDTDTVVGAGASSEFVEQDKTAFAEVVEDTCRLVHLHHKRTLAQRDIVAGTHAGENLVHHTD